MWVSTTKMRQKQAPKILFYLITLFSENLRDTCFWNSWTRLKAWEDKFLSPLRKIETLYNTLASVLPSNIASGNDQKMPVLQLVLKTIYTVNTDENVPWTSEASRHNARETMGIILVSGMLPSDHRQIDRVFITNAYHFNRIDLDNKQFCKLFLKKGKKFFI